jgi:hypothetical protein
MKLYSEIFAGLALSLIGVYLVKLCISVLIDTYKNRENV